MNVAVMLDASSIIALLQAYGLTDGRYSRRSGQSCWLYSVYNQQEHAMNCPGAWLADAGVCTPATLQGVDSSLLQSLGEQRLGRCSLQVAWGVVWPPASMHPGTDLMGFPCAMLRIQNNLQASTHHVPWLPEH